MEKTNESLGPIYPNSDRLHKRGEKTKAMYEKMVEENKEKRKKFEKNEAEYWRLIME